MSPVQDKIAPAVDADLDDLVFEAQRAQKNAYAPYSGYPVGVAIRTSDGDIFSGCCVENASYLGLESTEAAIGALFSNLDWMLYDHVPHITDMVTICPIIDDNLKYLPAGESLSALRRFARPDTRLYFQESGGRKQQKFSLQDLAPHSAVLKTRHDDYKQRITALQTKRKKQVEEYKAGDNDVMDKLRMQRLRAFSLFSGYAVGAIVKTEDGRYFGGCNIETAPHRALHAESVAIANMVSECGPDARITECWVMVDGEHAFPCGDCRQKISEFSRAGTDVFAVNLEGDTKKAFVKDLLPGAFGRDYL